MTTHFPIQSMASSTSSMSKAPQVAAEDELLQVKILTSTNDDHGGVIVEMNEPMDSTTFVSILRASISHWKHLVFLHINLIYLLILLYLI